ncbi:MAG: alpha/beta hydrolase family protein [Armatimonadota bacterium]
MDPRNLSPLQMFTKLAQEHTPLCQFNGTTKPVFESWKADTYPKVKATLGDWPERVDLNPELMVEWEQDGLRKQRWLIDVGRHISASLIVCYPTDIKKGEKRPAILAWHGHGQYGKEPVMGNDSSPALRADIQNMNYNYGHVMALNGYVTFGIDWIGAGERNDAHKPHFLSHAGSRDWCNLYYLHATMLGMTSLSINITHGMAATDFVSSLPEVDADRMGVMGLSGGGTMTLWSALMDDRFKAAEVMCYSDLWEVFLFHDLNACGMQVAPGLYKQVDLPDLQGLLAPKPLLVDIGVYDTCFSIDSSMKCFHKLEKIYQAAEARHLLELDLFAGEHGWGTNKSVEFFGKYL